MDYFEVYIYGDQPVSCPKCGNRTDVKLDLLDSKNTQIHKCLTILCGFEFICENDLEIKLWQ